MASIKIIEIINLKLIYIIILFEFSRFLNFQLKARVVGIDFNRRKIN